MVRVVVTWSGGVAVVGFPLVSYWKEPWACPDEPESLSWVNPSWRSCSFVVWVMRQLPFAVPSLFWHALWPCWIGPVVSCFQTLRLWMIWEVVVEDDCVVNEVAVLVAAVVV